MENKLIKNIYMKQLIIASLIALSIISSSAMENEKAFEFLSKHISSQQEFEAFGQWSEYKEARMAVEAYEKDLLEVYKTQHEKCKNLILAQIIIPFFCKECGDDFVQRKHLIEHIVSQHPNKLLRCTFAGCSRRFYDQEEQKKHLERLHLYCKACLLQNILKVFISVRGVEQHQSSHGISYVQPRVMAIAQNQLNDIQVEEQFQTYLSPIPALFAQE